jgi:hypothetical protein
MSNLKSALTRKFGPLPAWAWAAIAGGALFLYRRYSAASGAVSGTGTGSVAQAGPTPGTGEQVLQPGESIYDPGAGTLTTAPGGGGTDTTGTNATALDLAAAMDNLANAIATGMPAQQVNVSGGGKNTSGTKHGHQGHRPKLTAKGATYAPFGHNKPKAKKGFTTKGLGHGFWEYVPKAKGQNKAKGKTSQHPNKSHKPGTRSTASKRSTNGGRFKASTLPEKISGSKTTPALRGLVNAVGKPTPARQRAKTPAVSTVVRQRPTATHPAAKPKGAAPAPRPSAPAPRTVRSPAKAPPKPAAKRRK